MNVTLKLFVLVVVCFVLFRRCLLLVICWLSLLGRLFKIIVVVIIFCWFLLVDKIVCVIVNHRFWWFFLRFLLLLLLLLLARLLLLFEFLLFFLHLFSDFSVDFIFIRIYFHLRFLDWIFRLLSVTPLKDFINQIFIHDQFINTFDDFLNEK